MQTATALKTGQVNQAVDDLEASIASIGDEVAYLEERLRAVIVEQDSALSKEPGATAPARSELAATLNNSAGRVHALANRLSILRNSLDL